jgi:long-subunit fatty acid transport protein
MLNRDVIEANITGFRARVGMIYREPGQFNLGINYQFRSVLTVDEEYRTFIETTFDNNDFFDDKFTGEVRYKVESPARLSAGIAIASINKLTISASGEWVNYSNMKMKWADDDIDLTDTHFNRENDFIEDTYRSVINLEGGLSYQYTNVVRPYLGYAYYPAPSEDSEADRSFLSGGVNLGRERELNVNVGVQYAMWNDQLILYNYENSSGSLITESAHEEVGRLQVIVGLSYRF